MKTIEKVCKWLACCVCDNFDSDYDTFRVCGYDLTECVCMVADFNEHGFPVFHLFSFDDSFDDESIENCKTVIMMERPLPLVGTCENVCKLFSLMVDLKTAFTFGVQDIGCNTFRILDNGSCELVKNG